MLCIHVNITLYTCIMIFFSLVINTNEQKWLLCIFPAEEHGSIVFRNKRSIVFPRSTVSTIFPRFSPQRFEEIVLRIFFSRRIWVCGGNDKNYFVFFFIRGYDFIFIYFKMSIVLEEKLDRQFSKRWQILESRIIYYQRINSNVFS